MSHFMYSYFVSCIVGIVFLLSGLSKAVNVLNFQYHIIQYGFPFLNVLAPCIVLLEIYLGSLFLLNIKIKRISLLSAFILFFFFCLYLYGYYVYGIKDCGCMGDVVEVSSPIFVVIRNLVLITLCLYLYFKGEAVGCYLWKKKILLTIMFPSFFIVGMTFRYIPIDSKQHVLQGVRISDTVLGNQVMSDDKDKLICFFSYDCPHCWNSIAQLDSYKSTGLVDSICVYMVKTLDDNADDRILFSKYFHDFQYEEIHKDSLGGLINGFPTVLLLKQDSIEYVFKGTLPSASVYEVFMRD